MVYQPHCFGVCAIPWPEKGAYLMVARKQGKREGAGVLLPPSTVYPKEQDDQAAEGLGPIWQQITEIRAEAAGEDEDHRDMCCTTEQLITLVLCGYPNPLSTVVM